MPKKTSFDSENSSCLSDSDIEDAETKEQTHKNEKEDEEEDEKEDDDKYIKLDTIDLIKSISNTLETILQGNKYQQNYKDIIQKQSDMVFSAKNIPNISIEDYLKRIQKYANMEKSTLIISLIFIDRLCKISNLALTYYNIHRILFTSILISIKYNEDCFYDNKYYSEIAGVKLKELKSLEYNFVKMIHFRFFVNDEIFEKYKQCLENLEQS